jgi:histidine ammonia-lyase
MDKGPCKYGANLATQALQECRDMCAIELMNASQAMEFETPLNLSFFRIFLKIRKVVPFIKN